MEEGGHRLAIVTDSTCDIPRHLIEQYGIVVVPLYVVWGSEELRDGEDIDSASFYVRLASDPIHPKTSQPTPADFVRAIEAVQAAGAQEVLAITISERLSGTLGSVRLAQQMVDIPVHAVDSYSVTMGLGWQVLAAARARERGDDLEAIISQIQRVREALSVLLTVDTLDYLHRGGRIGGGARFLGSVIQLKPLLGLDHSTGTLEAVERIRTRRKAVQRLLEAIFEQVDATQATHVAVMHSAAAEEAQVLLDSIQAQYDPLELITSEITPVLGVHAGPGALAICAYSE